MEKAPLEPLGTAPSKLKPAAPNLFCRSEELMALDAAWGDPGTHVAWRGVGKTSLVALWAAGLTAHDFDGAD